MANGSGNFAGYKNTSKSKFGIYCTYNYSQNTSGNYTDVVVRVYVVYYTLNINSRTVDITVDGQTKQYTVSAIKDLSWSQKEGTDRLMVKSETFRVNHNNDGTKKSIPIKVVWNCNLTYAGTKHNSITASTTIASFPTIPRASTITSAGDITLGDSCSIKWTPASSSFKYKIKFSLGSSWNYTTGFIEPKSTSAYTYAGKPTSDTSKTNITTIYKKLPNSITGQMTAVLYTYNSSGTQIGSTSTKTFKVTIPSSVKPKIGTITLTPSVINNQNILVQNKNKC